MTVTCGEVRAHFELPESWQRPDSRLPLRSKVCKTGKLPLGQSGRVPDTWLPERFQDVSRAALGMLHQVALRVPAHCCSMRYLTSVRALWVLALALLACDTLILEPYGKAKVVLLWLALASHKKPGAGVSGVRHCVPPVCTQIGATIRQSHGGS